MHVLYFLLKYNGTFVDFFFKENTVHHTFSALKT